MITRHTIPMLACAASLMLAACAGKTNIPDDPSVVFPHTLTAKDFNADDPTFPARATDQHTKLQPGDVLRVNVIGDDLVTGDFAIGPDGVVAVPLVGDVAAGGRQRVEVATEIREKLAPYYTEPQLTVSVASYTPRRAYVLGAVNAAGSQELAPDDTLLTVLSKAGGPSERRNEREQSLGFSQMARVIRGDSMAFINLRKVLEGEDTRSNIAIYPNDVIYVPLEGTPTVAVLGEVTAPGLVGLAPGMDIIQAVALAGGMTREAEGTKIRVMRGWWTEEPQLYTLNYLDLRKTKDRVPPLVLQDQDIVYVETRGLAKWNYVLRAVSPTMAFLGPGAAGP